jgi:hypothetical protein
VGLVDQVEFTAVGTQVVEAEDAFSFGNGGAQAGEGRRALADRGAGPLLL